MDEVLGNRTRYLTAVLKDVYNSHNTSAVIRSCEALGIQDVHIIEKENRYRVNRQVTQGATRWLTLHRYRARERDPTETAIRYLKDAGYRLIGATPDADRVVDDDDLAVPTAVVFGTEIDGLSDQTREALDGTFRIPLYGFSQSLNLSVAAATVLRTLTGTMRARGRDWRLSSEESADLRFAWYRRTIRESDVMVRRFIANMEAGD